MKHNELLFAHSNLADLLFAKQTNKNRSLIMECLKSVGLQRWEFIKENKKVRKQEETRTRPRKRSRKKEKKKRKHAIDQESVQEKKTLFFS